MPSRRQLAFEALCAADEAARGASRLFYQACDTAMESNIIPPAPWDTVAALYVSLKNAREARNNAYAAFGAVVGLTPTKEKEE